MWIHDEGRTYPLLDLVGQTVAGVLYKLGKLSSSFFSPKAGGLKDITVDCFRVIPSLAYQLAQNVPATLLPVAYAVLQDASIFNLETQTQIKSLLLNPLIAAAKSEMMDTQEGIPKVFLIHGLERFDDARRATGEPRC